MEGLKQWTTEEVIEDILLEIMIEYKMTDEVARHSIKETLQRFYHRVIVKRKLPQECIEIMNNASNT